MARRRRAQFAMPRIVSRGLHGQEFFPIGSIAILEPESNRGTDGLPMAHSRKNFCTVLFDLLPSAASIAKLPAPQFVIDEFQVHWHLRRQSGNKRQQRLSMRLTRGVQP